MTIMMETGTTNDNDVIWQAVAVLKGDSPVTGTITFEQSSKNGPVKVTGEVNNLDPFSKRGFHIQWVCQPLFPIGYYDDGSPWPTSTLGDITNGCLSSGPHYNPFDRNHGAPYVRERHVGDLGNIQSNRDGVSEVDFYDGSITLNGYLSIVGYVNVIEDHSIIITHSSHLFLVARLLFTL